MQENPLSVNYRADIDGLRAIAVLAVIFFHAGVPGFSGGFIGVDIFFVISGFLITSIILKEINNGKFSIARFYERRIRRIFPALFFVIAVTSFGGAVLFEPASFIDLAATITSTTLFFSNIWLWQHAGYFDVASIERPLLHTWSLAVEEQFYIVFPLLLVAINRFFSNKYLHWLIGIWISSFLISIWGVHAHPNSTFYLVHTRAWELISGSILATGLLPQLKSEVKRNLLSAGGFGLVLFSIVFYTESTPFPGASALVPVMGCSMLIYSGIEGKATVINRLMSIKPLVFIGLISYSLYLWHWPVIVMTKYFLFRQLTPLETIGIIVAIFIISIISLEFIEKPFRGNYPIFPQRKPLFIIAATTILITAISGYAVALNNGFPNRSHYVSTLLDRAHQGGDNIGSPVTKIEHCTIKRVGAADREPTFIIWGDSHAGTLVPTVDLMGKSYDLSGYTAAFYNRPPLLGVDIDKDNTHVFNDSILLFIKNHPEINTVFLVGMWERYASGHRYNESNPVKLTDTFSNSSNASNVLVVNNSLSRTVKAILALNRKVVIVSDVPELGVHAVRLCWVKNITGESITGHLPTIQDYTTRNNNANALLNGLSRTPGVSIIHPESLLFDHNGRAIIIADNKTPTLLYTDSDHLSTYGAFFVAPAFQDVFRRMASTQHTL